jgi:hypothetical protein
MKMKSMWGTTIAVTAALFLFAGSAVAQDEDEGPITQGDDAKYISVGHIQFKPGKREGAMEIITEYFAPATAKAGLPGPLLVIHYQTGKWDLAAVWSMDGGMADLEWYRSADDIKWMAALVEIAGGEDEAGEIMEKWQSSVADSLTEVGHHHVPEAD